MHTLGHAGMQMRASHHVAQAVATMAGAAHEPVADSDVTEHAAGTVYESGCAHVPGPSPHGGMSSWSVCLAVLGAFATLVLLVMLVARSGRRGPPAPGTGTWAVVSRGPPARHAGLAVAALSVLCI